ncbi:MAG TPA: hypothetical protein VFH66_09180 [Mycobacteriales bacterium]|nr:hypothetical protein [Mycobacteriales bacterium]
MTEPNEATIPDGPEKAHGDALEQLVDEPSDGRADDDEADAES